MFPSFQGKQIPLFVALDYLHPRHNVTYKYNYRKILWKQRKLSFHGLLLPVCHFNLVNY